MEARTMELEAYLSAEERAQLIEAEFKALSPQLAELTPHLYKTDRPRFDGVDRSVSAGLIRIETMTVGLRMAADSEYTPMPWHVRLLLWLFCWIGAVQRVRQPMVKATRCYQARIDAADRYEELVDEHREYIHDIRYAKVNRRSEELLHEHGEYQELLASVPKLEESLAEAIRNASASTGVYRNRLKRVRARMHQIETKIWNQALREFSNEDF